MRPERPRREIPDFDYSYSAMSANITAAETSAESAGIYCPREETTDNNTVYVKTEQGLQVFIEYNNAGLDSNGSQSSSNRQIEIRFWLVCF